VSFLANKQSVPDHVRLAQVGNHFPQHNKNFGDVASAVRQRQRSAPDALVLLIIIIQHLYSAIVSYAGCRGA